MYGFKSSLQLGKAIFILFFLMIVLTALSNGIDGIKGYVNSVNYLALVKELFVFLISVSIIFLLFVVGYNLYLSISYCSKNSIQLINFYKKDI